MKPNQDLSFPQRVSVRAFGLPGTTLGSACFFLFLGVLLVVMFVFTTAAAFIFVDSMLIAVCLASSICLIAAREVVIAVWLEIINK